MYIMSLCEIDATKWILISNIRIHIFKVVEEVVDPAVEAERMYQLLLAVSISVYIYKFLEIWL
jgi:hypothetical protein